MDRRMVFNHYRFFISFNIPSHLSVMVVTIILDVVVYGVVGHLMGCLIKDTTKFRFLIVLDDEAVMYAEYWDVLLSEVINHQVSDLTVYVHQSKGLPSIEDTIELRVFVDERI